MPDVAGRERWRQVAPDLLSRIRPCAVHREWNAVEEAILRASNASPLASAVIFTVGQKYS